VGDGEFDQHLDNPLHRGVVVLGHVVQLDQWVEANEGQILFNDLLFEPRAKKYFTATF